MKSRPVSLCLKVSPPSTAGSLGFFMVYIFFLFATVKPPVNSPGWFTCSENNVRHTALIGDERLQERLFVSVKPTSASSARPPPLSVPSRVCLRHFVWTRAKVPICCVSRFSAHGACTHDSLHISMCVCVCVCRFLQNYLRSSAAPKSHTYAKTTHVRIRVRRSGRTIPRVQTHAQQMGAGCFGSVVCLCVEAGESYLCHHEYVIKPPLKKDGVPRQGVHEAPTRVFFFVSSESVLWALSCIQRWREEENK